MNSSPGRIAAITAGLMVAGGIFGAVSAAIGAMIAISITEGPGHAFDIPIVPIATVIGAMLGAPLLPATSFLLLRRVPLGLSWVGTALGTVAGAVIGWVVATSVPDGNWFTWPVIGALIGFFAAVAVLRLRFSADAGGQRVPRPAA